MGLLRPQRPKFATNTRPDPIPGAASQHRWKRLGISLGNCDLLDYGFWPAYEHPVVLHDEEQIPPRSPSHASRLVISVGDHRKLHPLVLLTTAIFDQAFVWRTETTWLFASMGPVEYYWMVT